MQKTSILFRCLCVAAILGLMAGCAGTTPQPTAESFTTPSVTLEAMEVAHSFGYWYFSKSVKPTKGQPDDVGAPLDLAFIFNIENPNTFPVKMESLNFSVAFEDFELNTVSSKEVQWIPPGKTNQLRVHAHFDVRQSLLSLLVTGGFKLKEKETNAWEQLEKWWAGIPEYKIPIHVKMGSAVFKADGLMQVATFNATFP